MRYWPISAPAAIAAPETAIVMASAACVSRASTSRRTSGLSVPSIRSRSCASPAARTERNASSIRCRSSRLMAEEDSIPLTLGAELFFACVIKAPDILTSLDRDSLEPPPLLTIIQGDRTYEGAIPDGRHLL